MGMQYGEPARKSIRAYMQSEILDHVDPLTGEVNSTSLAEDAAAKFDLYEEERDVSAGFEIPEWVFEMASEIGDLHEIATGVKDPPRK